MNSHLSEENLKDYLENKIAAEELLAVDDHLADCDVCVTAMEAASDIRNSGDSIAVDAFPSHLSFESVEAFVKGSADPVDAEIAGVHLERCTSCSETFNELVALQKQLELSDERPRVKAETAVSGGANGMSAFFRRPLLIPAFGLLLAGVIGTWWLVTRNDADQAADLNVVQPPMDNIVPPPIEDNTNSNTTQPDVTIIASINDGGKTIELSADGRITGLSLAQFESRVRNALTKQEIAIPADARQLNSPPGVLMSGQSEGVPFALVSPVGKVIESSSPTLTWKPVSGAENYTVEIFDENFGRVASSGPLQNTRWRTEKPLVRGKVYVWQVTATKDGNELKSPVRPAPDAKFMVISGPQADAITVARRTGGSRLVLGILYAEAGMLVEAEREFLTLSRSNPNSDILRKLLAKVRTAR